VKAKLQSEHRACSRGAHCDISSLGAPVMQGAKTSKEEKQDKPVDLKEVSNLDYTRSLDITLFLSSQRRKKTSLPPKTDGKAFN